MACSEIKWTCKLCPKYPSLWTIFLPHVCVSRWKEVGMSGWIVFWVWSQPLNFKILHTGAFFSLLLLHSVSDGNWIQCLVLIDFFMTERERWTPSLIRDMGADLRAVNPPLKGQCRAFESSCFFFQPSPFKMPLSPDCLIQLQGGS